MASYLRSNLAPLSALCALLTNACLPSTAWQPPRDVSHDDRFSALLAAGDGKIEWKVADRFRLLTQPGATAELFRRYQSYYDTVCTQDNSHGALATWWDEEEVSYTPGYLEVSKWLIELTAPFEGGDCDWQIGNTAAVPGRCKGFTAEFRDEETTVSVHQRGKPAPQERTVIRPRDVLIVTLGDSYASGEGVPDLRRGYISSADWMDERCHRSLYAGPGLAALMYAKLNPHVSVTHLSFACSGAKFREGLIEGYKGVVSPLGRGALPQELPPQVDALRAVLARSGRRVDYLTLSIGGNDLGFSDIVLTALVSGLSKVKKSIARHVPSGDSDVRFLTLDLKSKLARAGVRAPLTKILVTEYPNPTNLWKVPEGTDKAADLANACGTGGGDEMAFVPGFRIGQPTWNAINGGVSGPLGELVKHINSSIGGKLVEGIDEDFRRHGYCAPSLSLPDGTVRWINTFPDGRIAGFFEKNGAMHPNIRGQDSYARHILKAVVAEECGAGKIAATDGIRKQLCDADQWKLQMPGKGIGADAKVAAVCK